VEKVECAKDLDEVIEAHEKFLEKIMCQCLLDPGSQPILTRLRAIYDLIIMFQQKQAAMFSTGLSEVDRRCKVEEVRDERAEQVQSM
jgi:gamma-tubulin complex component 3